MLGRVPDEKEFAVYKAYLDDLGRLGGRHEAAFAAKTGPSRTTDPLFAPWERPME